MSRDQYHPEPEVRELAGLAESDDIVEVLVMAALRKAGVRNLTDLFAVDPNTVFELHDQVMTMNAELAPEADDLTELGLMPDPTLEWSESE